MPIWSAGGRACMRVNWNAGTQRGAHVCAAYVCGTSRRTTRVCRQHSGLHTESDGTASKYIKTKGSKQLNGKPALRLTPRACPLQKQGSRMLAPRRQASHRAAPARTPRAPLTHLAVRTTTSTCSTIGHTVCPCGTCHLVCLLHALLTLSPGSSVSCSATTRALRGRGPIKCVCQVKKS